LSRANLENPPASCQNARELKTERKELIIFLYLYGTKNSNYFFSSLTKDKSNIEAIPARLAP
jgi:hypothetical protein